MTQKLALGIANALLSEIMGDRAKIDLEKFHGTPIRPDETIIDNDVFHNAPGVCALRLVALSIKSFLKANGGELPSKEEAGLGKIADDLADLFWSKYWLSKENRTGFTTIGIRQIDGKDVVVGSNKSAPDLTPELRQKVVQALGGLQEKLKTLSDEEKTRLIQEAMDQILPPDMKAKIITLPFPFPFGPLNEPKET